MTERTIRLTGVGNVSIKPEITIVTLNFNKLFQTYDKALEASAADTLTVKSALECAGIKRNTLKTTYFDIDTKYRSEKDEKGNYKSIFEGYKYSQTLRFEFNIDNKLLGRVLYELSKIDIGMTFNLRYGVKDVENAKNLLLESAVKDAMKKANIMAKASGCELGEVLSITYNWDEIDFEDRHYSTGLECRDVKAKLSCCAPSYDIDIEPDDISRSDEVKIIVSLK